MKKNGFLYLGIAAVFLGSILYHITIGVGFACQLMVGVGAVFIFYGLLKSALVQNRWPKASRILRMGLYGAVILLLTSFLAIEGLIIAHRDSEPYNGDFIIVLGAGLYGETPSQSLLSRLEIAEAYLAAHPEAIAILSGGQGSGESITEAEAMRRYLQQQGIASERLWLEESSTNTRENLLYSKMLLQQRGLASEQIELAIVTNDFHQYRAQKLATQMKLRTVPLSAPVPDVFGLAFNCYVREYFAVCKFYLQTFILSWI